MSVSLLIIIIVTAVLAYFLIKWLVKKYNSKDLEINNEIEKEVNTPFTQEKPSKYSFSQINETYITHQPDGVEERIIDNSKNSGIVKRKLLISREWKKTVLTSKEFNNKIRAKVGIPYNIIEVEIDKLLKDRYSTSVEETKYFSEEIELEIGAYTKMLMRISWKIIWQNGEIYIINETGEKLSIPFKIKKGLTFDQVQENIK